MSKSKPRKQHYVPVFYLRSFCESTGLDAKLFVTDFKTGDQWRVTARRAGFENDFYTVDKDFGNDPYVVERELARIESLVVPYYRDVIAKRCIPTRDHLDVILRFVSLLAVRTPGIRRTLLAASQDQVRQLLQRLADSEELYRVGVTLLEELGEHVDSLPPRAELQRILPHADFVIEHNQTELLKIVLPVHQYVTDLLTSRDWSLAVIEDPTLHFVTSDTPLHLMARRSSDRKVLLNFELPYQEIYVPLSRQVALVSKGDRPDTCVADSEGVAIINSHAIWGARFAYSARKDFLLFRDDRSVRSSSEYLNFIRASAGDP